MVAPTAQAHATREPLKYGHTRAIRPRRLFAEEAVEGDRVEDVIQENKANRLPENFCPLVVLKNI